MADKASEFASYWGGEKEAYAAGLLHDLGKYSERFQKVLRREDHNVDHWTHGAIVALERWKRNGIKTAVAIQGHHKGLLSCERYSLIDSLDPSRIRKGDERTLPDESANQLLKRFKADGLSLPTHIEAFGDSHEAHPVALQLHVRMLFSALVDADYLCTEAHFMSTRRNELVFKQKGEMLKADEQWKRILEHLVTLRQFSQSSDELQMARDDLMAACVRAAEAPPGLFTLTSPTGSGKTLATLAFAVRHALKNDLRRIIVVLPFLSILDQTVDTYRRVLDADNRFLLEDHSLVDTRNESQSGKVRLLAPDWDSPIIVTTTVKFFDSLFSAHPGTCRKLHRYAGSVVIFDEAQTMPSDIAAPTLSALACLVEHYRSTVVFSTATQPAFKVLNSRVKTLSGTDWQPTEIVSAELKLFERLRRVEARFWPDRIPLQTLASELTASKRVLVVLNTKRQARLLYSYLQEQGQSSLFHLSTDMCPAHRRAVVEVVKRRLKVPDQCTHLISTQCIEAGVDIDFPELWRVLAPWDSLVQAAGRCNREGRQARGILNIFLPDGAEEAYPSAEYERASKLVLELIGDNWNELFDSDRTTEYFRRLYARLDEQARRSKELLAAITSRDLAETDRKYAWIEKTGQYNVLVPYQNRIDDYQCLCGKGLNGGADGDWLRRARELSVSVNLSQEHINSGWFSPVYLRREEVKGWLVLLDDTRYSSDTGLLVDSLTDRQVVTSF